MEVGEKIEILNHIYLKKDNGTIEQPEERLMWIGAPIGCKWVNGRFQNEPIGISWDEATRKYGKGCKVSWFDGCNRNVYLDAFNKEYGYQKGEETFWFANYSDWRMPTINELKSLFDPFSKLSRTEISLTEFNKLYEKLFPNFPSGSKIWSANYSTEAVFLIKIIRALQKKIIIPNAWCYHPRSWLYNDSEGKWKNLTVLVRNI